MTTLLQRTVAAAILELWEAQDSWTSQGARLPVRDDVIIRLMEQWGILIHALDLTATLQYLDRQPQRTVAWQATHDGTFSETIEVTVLDIECLRDLVWGHSRFGHRVVQPDSSVASVTGRPSWIPQLTAQVSTLPNYTNPG